MPGLGVGFVDFVAGAQTQGRRSNEMMQRTKGVGSPNGIYGTACSSGSFHLGTGEFHHFGPLVTFLGNQFRKIGGRH